ncbi:MAG: hypothetical protein WKG07_09760 [Hymenobacter sp.]
MGDVVRQGFRLQRLQRLPNRALGRRRQPGARPPGFGRHPQSEWPTPPCGGKRGRAATWFRLASPTCRPTACAAPDASGRVWLRFRDLLAVTYEGERPDANFRLAGLGIGPAPTPLPGIGAAPAAAPGRRSGAQRRARPSRWHCSRRATGASRKSASYCPLTISPPAFPTY